MTILPWTIRRFSDFFYVAKSGMIYLPVATSVQHPRKCCNIHCNIYNNVYVISAVCKFTLSNYAQTNYTLSNYLLSNYTLSNYLLPNYSLPNADTFELIATERGHCRTGRYRTRPLSNWEGKNSVVKNSIVSLPQIVTKLENDFTCSIEFCTATFAQASVQVH